MEDVDREVAERAEQRIGTTLRGKYRVDSVLGIGGMAVVYVVTHRNQKRFALKMLHPELSVHASIRQRFLREGYAANTVNHPGAVAVLDDDVAEDGAAFLVMELLDGVPVDTLLEARERHLPARAVLAMTHQLLGTLAAAHAKSVVHRDIKPPNLFLLGDGTLKVLDFGIARVKDATSAGNTTHAGATLGTPAFMAPEQAIGDTPKINGQTDLWAVGATMFTLMSGEYVHTGESSAQLVVEAATRPSRSLAVVRQDAPTSVVELVDKALAFTQADRWASAPVMSDVVASVYESLYGEPISRTPLVALVEEHGRRAATRRQAEAHTESAGAAAPANAPMKTIEEAARASFTRPATAGSFNRPGDTTSHPVTTSRGASSWGRWPRVLVPVAAVLAAAAGVAAYLGARAPERPQAVTVAEPPIHAPATPPPTASLMPAETPPAADEVVKLEVSPANASVEVDGSPTSLVGGFVAVSGTPGSMHLVHVVLGKRGDTYPVLLTKTGPVPRKVELATPSGSTPGGPVLPRASATPSAHAQPAAPAAAPSGNVSRTME